MMTLGQVITLLTGLFNLLMEYLAPLFQKEEENADETTAEA